jgi:hypothetical protein
MLPYRRIGPASQKIGVRTLLRAGRIEMENAVIVLVGWSNRVFVD